MTASPEVERLAACASWERDSAHQRALAADLRALLDMNERLHEDLTDLSLLLTRMATDTASNVSLDEVLEHFGYTREQLERANDQPEAVHESAADLKARPSERTSQVDVPKSTDTPPASSGRGRPPRRRALRDRRRQLAGRYRLRFTRPPGRASRYQAQAGRIKQASPLSPRVTAALSRIH